MGLQQCQFPLARTTETPASPRVESSTRTHRVLEELAPAPFAPILRMLFSSEYESWQSPDFCHSRRARRSSGSNNSLTTWTQHQVHTLKIVPDVPRYQ